MSISRTADNFYALRLTRLLHMNFQDWAAYKQGIIDEKGEVIKKPVSDKDKSAWTKFHVAVRNLKKMAAKIPGFQQLISMGAGYLLLKEIAEDNDLDSVNFINEVSRLNEAVVAGDSGGSVDNIAKGQTTGAVTSPGPSEAGDKTVKKKKKIKKFKEFLKNG